MKQEILKLAVEGLKAGGYQNLSFTTISDALCTSRANMHHHFKNKEGLAIEATRLYIKEHREVTLELTEKNKGNFPGFLADLEEIFFDLLNEKGATGICVCAQLIRENDIPLSLRTLAREHMQYIITNLRDQIIESKKQGTLISETDSERLPIQVLTIFLGMVQMAFTIEGDESLLNQLKSILVDSIRPYQPSSL